MTGDGATAAVLSDSLVAAVGLEAPTVWVGLFLGVFVGLLLVAFVAGRQLVGSEAAESPRQTPDREGDPDEESTAATDPERAPETAASIDEGRTQTGEIERNERLEGRLRSTTRADRDVDDGDRLLELLEESDGQLRQSHIVAETEWSKTKVSRTLSRLADEDEVVKIQLGRENLICLPGDVPSIGRERES